MRHRHINDTAWTRAAIDSVLERGDLDDWKELFQAAKANRELAKDILAMAVTHKEDGTAELVAGILRKTHPELFALEP